MSSYTSIFLTETTESIGNKLVRNALLVDLIIICYFVLIWNSTWLPEQIMWFDWPSIKTCSVNDPRVDLFKVFVFYIGQKCKMINPAELLLYIGLYVWKFNFIGWCLIVQFDWFPCLIVQFHWLTWNLLHDASQCKKYHISLCLYQLAQISQII